LRDETELDTVNGDLVGVVRETMQPTYASLWLLPDTASKPTYASLWLLPDTASKVDGSSGKTLPVYELSCRA